MPDTQYLHFLPLPVGPVPPSTPSQTLVSITRSGNIIWGRYKYLQGFHVRKGSEFQGWRIPVEKALGSTSQCCGDCWKPFLAWLTSFFWFSQTLCTNLNHVKPDSVGNTWSCMHLLLRMLCPLKNYFFPLYPLYLINFYYNDCNYILIVAF